MDTFTTMDTSINHLLKTDKRQTLTEHLNHDDSFHQHLEDQYKDASCHFLRFWEATEYGIVLGRSNKATREVYERLSQEANIPIITRSSGGGTVLLGPGCLCFSLFIPTSHPSCQGITQSNDFIMDMNRQALSGLLPDVHVRGYTDLCMGEQKFSGNSQRRKKQWILFHGTFLYDFDLDHIGQFLQHPSKEPDYRNGRDHSRFIRNCPLSSEVIQKALLAQWDIT